MSTSTIERTENASDSARSSPPKRNERTPQVGVPNREPAERVVQSADQRTGKYLTFLLGREEFAIQVLKVREIMGFKISPQFRRRRSM